MQITRKILLLGMFLMFGLVNSAWSYVINDTSSGVLNGTDVGVLDLFIAEDAKQGNTRKEIDWANGYMDSDINRRSGWKEEDVKYFETNVSDVYAFELVATSGYYVVKNAKRVALFQNLNSLDWGVFDASVLSDGIKLPRNKMTISHVTQFGIPTGVPEPSSIALLGFGLVGLFWARRQK